MVKRTTEHCDHCDNIIADGAKAIRYRVGGDLSLGLDEAADHASLPTSGVFCAPKCFSAAFYKHADNLWGQPEITPPEPAPSK